MRLKTRARYALRMMTEIARREDTDPVSLGDVSDSTKISRRYLDQVAMGLKHAGLLLGIAGRGGGYRLGRSADEIHLGEIIEAAIGPINIVECVRQPESCIKSELCECRSVYALINRRITDVLNDISLSELVDKELLRKTNDGFETTGYACPTR